MKRMIFCSVFLVAIIGGNVSADVIHDIKSYMRLFSKEYKPTLADYRKAYPEDDSENELRIVVDCGKRGWVNPVPNTGTDNECSKYLRKLETNAKKVSSVYLAWLRTKVPLSAEVKILSSKVVLKKDKTEGEYPPYQLIRAKLNDVNVVFWRNVNKDDQNVEGVISIIEIEGMSVNEMFKKYLKTVNSKNKRAYEVGH